MAKLQHKGVISIHALREEGDHLMIAVNSRLLNFYPRPPRGGRRAQFASGWSASKFLSTPSARRATHVSKLYATESPYFYPRPPRGGRPAAAPGGLLSAVFLSTPSARRATPNSTPSTLRTVFLSTPSARRATAHNPLCGDCALDFYPRPPRGGRRGAVIVRR